VETELLTLLSTWVYLECVRFVLLNLLFSVYGFVTPCLYFCPFFVCLFCCLFSDLRLLIASLASSNFSYPCFVGRDLCCSLYQFSVLTIFVNCVVDVDGFFLIVLPWFCRILFIVLVSFYLTYVSNSFQTLNAIRWQPLISPWDMVKHLMGDDTESNMSSNVLCKENPIPQWCM